MAKKQKGDYSPMMQHYLSIKEQNPDKIVFYRLGDFYEMFFEDAITVSRELELTLTGRDAGQGERAPMCGVPHARLNKYSQALVNKGYKVAICDQIEDPSTAQGLVKREIVRVITPGTLLDTEMLEEGTNNYICSIYADDMTGHNTPCEFGIAFCDVSTGEIHMTQIRSDGVPRMENELSRFAPAEIIYNQDFEDVKELMEFIKNKLSCAAGAMKPETYDLEQSKHKVLKQFEAESLEEIGLENAPLMIRSLGGLLCYLEETQRHGLETVRRLDIYEDNQFMALDLTARRNLELTQTLRSGEKKGSLLGVIDKTKTAMGKRLLRAWIEKPLINPTLINKRLNAVEELVNNSMVLADIQEDLTKIFDIERLITKIVYGNVTPRELRSLQYTLQKLPVLKEHLSAFSCQHLREIDDSIDALEDVSDFLERAIEDEPPIALKDGGVIRKGYSKELDKLRNLVQNTKGVLAEIEASEKEKTGIKTLKIGFNNVFGYYIEVSKSFGDQVPENYVRRQTLANSERFITQELKELEETILGAKDKIIVLESKLYNEIRDMVSGERIRIQQTASAIAKLDVFASLAQVAVLHNYCHPQVDFSDNIHITEGRHPVVESMLQDNIFVSNDTLLDNKDNQVSIITGPNMAGKSTYMRQTALIVLLAQIGSFVPAKAASIGVVDGIYTRVGASDDLSSGQSTFMIEMSEVAQILKNCTSKSLLILDEIGRGTSTFDGMSIARAVVEHIANKRKCGAKTLFATHYHELTELEEQLPGVKNYNIAVKKKGEDIIFLRRIVRGGTDDSYGIYVSKLAGIPEEIVRRAESILEELEKGNPIAAKVSEKKRRKKEQDEEQLMLIQSDDSEIIRRLKEVDVDKMTPIQALILLGELKQLV